MKNKVIIDILERLMYEIEHDGYIDRDYIVYVKGVIEGLREGEDEEVRFTLPDCVVTDGTTGEQ